MLLYKYEVIILNKKNTLAERIYLLRIANNLTQDELGKIINTSKQTLYKYEKGIITNIPSDKIEKMAHVFGVTPAYLMGWETNNNSSILPSLTPHEIQHIKKYRALDERGKQAVDNTLDREYEFVKPKIEESAIS